MAKQIRSINFFQDLLKIFKSNGGISGSKQSIRLVIHNPGNSPVLILSIDANIIDRQSPVKGWFITENWGCSGGELILPHVALIDLDSGSSPRAVFYEGKSTSRVSKSLLIPKGDLAVVELYASTQKSYLKWKPRITYSTNSRLTTVDVHDANNEAFEVTSVIKSKSYKIQDGKLVRKPEWDYGITLCASESKLLAQTSK